MCSYIQETILLKKISKNVKRVVVPPRNVPKLCIRGVHDISKTIYHRSMKFCTLVEMWLYLIWTRIIMVCPIFFL